MQYATADFETSQDENGYMFVWLWAVCDIFNIEHIKYGYNIQTFFRYVSQSEDIKDIYFHNLGFDGKYIVDYLLRNDYIFTHDFPKMGQFSCTVSSKGKFYMLDIFLLNGKHIKIYDSLKVFPMSVKMLGESFQIISKGDIDYNKPRGRDYVADDNELDYICRDVKIPAIALRENFNANLEKMTVGSNALNSYKEMFGKKRFVKTFPSLSLEIDADIRKSYRGGYTFCADNYIGKKVGKGISVDYNSMYPSCMLMYPFPCGEPKYFKGKYVPDDNYPLYVQNLTLLFSLKKHAVPCLQLRNSGFYSNHEYVRETIEPVTITLTNIDMELLNMMYDVDVESYNFGYKFFGKKGMFDKYIYYWGGIKQNSKGGKRLQAKFMLNNLYGKFGVNPDVTPKFPKLVDNVVHWFLAEEKLRAPLYIPVATFCTAYARRELLTAIMANYERFIYCDTDSMHLMGWEDPNGIKIHEDNFCAWKIEKLYDRAKHLRAKAYILDINGELDVKCAGMPDNVKDIVTFDNFEFGFSNTQLIDGELCIIDGAGKLIPKAKPGGIDLIPSVYTLHV